MSAQTFQAAGGAGAPRVNLMPPEIAESARMRQIQLVMGLGVLLSVVVVALLYMHEHSKVNAAKSQLTAAQSAEAGLNSKLASLQTVAQTFADVQAKQAVLTGAMGGEVRWSGVLSDLSLRIPHNVYLTNLTLAQTVVTSPATPPNTPDAATIGTITFSGTALRHDDVAAWLDALAKERGLADPTFSSSSATGQGTVSFASTANVTTSAESGRYTPAAAAPTAPAAAPSTPPAG